MIEIGNKIRMINTEHPWYHKRYNSLETITTKKGSHKVFRYMTDLKGIVAYGTIIKKLEDRDSDDEYVIEVSIKDYPSFVYSLDYPLNKNRPTLRLIVRLDKDSTITNYLGIRYEIPQK